MEHDELEFLQQIALYPTDHVAKKVFADWLDEQGKPELAKWMREYPVCVTAWGRRNGHPIGQFRAYLLNEETAIEIPLTYIFAVCGIPPGSVDAVERIWRWNGCPICLKDLCRQDDIGSGSMVLIRYAVTDHNNPSVFGLTDVGSIGVYRLGGEWEVRLLNY